MDFSHFVVKPTSFVSERASLSPNEWSLMETILRLLQPFEEYTKLMSNNNSCISEVIPAVTVLQKFLSRDDGEKTAGVRTMRDELSSALERRFANSKFMFTSMHKRCTCEIDNLLNYLNDTIIQYKFSTYKSKYFGACQYLFLAA